MNISDPADVTSKFNQLNYGKGAMVIRMILSYLGENTWKSGFSNFVNKFQYSIGNTQDFWKAFEEVSQQPISNIFNPWVVQNGYPLLKFSQTINGNQRKVNIQQERFVLDGQLTTQDQKILWSFPLKVVPRSLIFAPNPPPISPVLVQGRSNVVILENVQPDEWVKVNHNNVAFARVQYSDGMLNQLKPGIQNMELGRNDRASIVDDMCALTQAGRYNAKQLLDFISLYKENTNYVPL